MRTGGTAHTLTSDSIKSEARAHFAVRLRESTPRRELIIATSDACTDKWRRVCVCSLRTKRCICYLFYNAQKTKVCCEATKKLWFRRKKNEIYLYITFKNKKKHTNLPNANNEKKRQKSLQNYQANHQNMRSI